MDDIDWTNVTPEGHGIIQCFSLPRAHWPAYLLAWVCDCVDDLYRHNALDLCAWADRTWSQSTGVANKNTVFMTLVGLANRYSELCEASLSPISTDSLYLWVAQNRVLTPCACVQGNYSPSPNLKLSTLRLWGTESQSQTLNFAVMR